MNQFEFDPIATFGAARKRFAFQKSDFMRQAMLLMNDLVNSAFSNLLASLESCRPHDGRYCNVKINARRTGIAVSRRGRNSKTIE